MVKQMFYLLYNMCPSLFILVIMLLQGFTRAVSNSTVNIEMPTLVANVSNMCTPVSVDHVCHSIPGRNTSYQYPQHLPDESETFSPSTVQIGFVLLRSRDPPFDPYCNSALEHIICLGASPPCTPQTDLLLPVCTESCLAFDRIIAEGRCIDVFNYGYELQADSQLPDFQLLFDLLFRFDCKNISTYVFYDNPESFIDPYECTDLFTKDEEERILSWPNQCIETPPFICDSTMGYNGYYVPLQGRNISNYIEEDFYTDTNCSDIVLAMSYYYLFPPCDPTTGNAISICLDSCEEFSALVEPCLANISQNNPLFDIARTFNCSDHATYLPLFVLVDNATCIPGVTIINGTQAPGPRSVTMTGAIVGATFGAFILVILVALVAVVFFFRSKRNKFQVLGYRVTTNLRRGNFNITSSKEHVYNDEKGEYGTKPNTDAISMVALSETDRNIYKKTFSEIAVPFASITTGKEVGQGAFGKVYYGEMLKQGVSDCKEEIAIKTIKHLTSREEVAAFLDESFVMKDFRHPNVLGLKGMCFDTPDGIPYILLSYMANGSLRDYLKKTRVHVTDVDTLPKGLNMSILIQMCLDIAQGMKYLAEMKFVHRDLAARNCMVDTSLKVKVGDFGLSRDIYTADYYRANKDMKVPVKWMPPETLHDGISNEKTDIWSYGVTCWELFSLGRTPYPGIQNHDILECISSDKRLQKPSLCPSIMYEKLMLECWNLRPEHRPTFAIIAELLEEYWEEEHAYVVESLATVV